MSKGRYNKDVIEKLSNEIEMKPFLVVSLKLYVGFRIL